MSGINPEHTSQLSFASDLTHLTRSKLLDAIQYIPYDESISMKAVNAGWFCIEPPVYSSEPIQGGDSFTVDYTGVQEGLGEYDDHDSPVRSTVISLKLYKVGQPYTFAEDEGQDLGNVHSIFAGGDAPPIIVNQNSLEPGIAQLDRAMSGLGNWQAMSRAKRLTAGRIAARVLTDSECRSIIASIVRANVDASTLMRSLQD